MKYVENGGDVRSTSADARYMGVEFSGTVDEAIAQAKAAPDYGVPALNGRAELLSFLRVPSECPTVLNHIFGYQAKLDELEAEAERDALDAWISAHAAPVDKFAHLSKYSLTYAIARGWVVPVVQS